MRGKGSLDGEGNTDCCGAIVPWRVRVLVFPWQGSARFPRDGQTGGEVVLAKGWIEGATTKWADTGTPGEGYGYQW